MATAKPETVKATLVQQSAERGAASTRPHVIALNLKGKSALYAAWMPLLKGGGLFLQSNQSCQLGDPVLVVVNFLDEPIKLSLDGKVAWINPPHASGGRAQGIGIALPDNDIGRQLKQRIEGLLAPAARSDRSTHTI